MMFMKRIGKKLAWIKGGSEDYLEVRVRDDASPADVDAIIQALATISSFFGVRLDTGGGGTGGSGIARSNRLPRVSLGNLISQDRQPGSPINIIPPKPPTDPNSRIGWRH